jgi:hypothetical protein
MERGQARIGRHGLLEVGDGKRAARDPRARSAAAGDFSLCPRPQGPLAAGECEAASEALWPGHQALSAVVREGPLGPLELSAAGEA